MITLKSESASKTQQNNAKILFGKTGLAVLKKLEEYSKEKQLDTKGIDAVLEVLKTKDTELLAKFAASKTGKTLVTNCKQLAKAKTFAAILKNIKAIKPLKSFDKFGGPAPVSVAKTKLNSLLDIYGELDPSQDYDEITKDFNRLTGLNASVVQLAADGGDNEALSVSIKGGTAYYLPAGQALTISKSLGLSGRKDAIYVDTYNAEGPFNGDADPIRGTIIEAKSKADGAKLLKTFLSWVKTGAPKVKPLSESDFTNRGPFALEQGLWLEGDSRGNFDMKDEETREAVNYMLKHGIGIESSNESGQSPIPEYILYGTKKALEGFALTILDFTRSDLRDLGIKRA